VVLFLLSDEARFISGDTLSIDAADCAKTSYEFEQVSERGN
jgi:hypothetical protein